MLLPKLLLCLNVLPVFAVTFTDVYNDLVVVDGDIRDLTTRANQYPGPGSTPGQSVAQLFLKFNQFSSDINKAKSDIQVATPTPVPTADAQKLYNYLCVTPSYPDATKWINALKAKRDALSTNGAKLSIRDYCTHIKTAYDAFFDVFVARSPTTTFKANVQTCKNKYDALLNDCISYFS